MNMATIRTVVEDEYGTDLEDIFMTFDQVPLGSASIAQVHKATLRNGKQIVVKVQRPSIYNMMEISL